jgi:methylated-DNA-protein-cysteine methyltransferase-like protein
MSSRARIYDAVRRIPRGRVSTYGAVAAGVGLPGHARQVGYALAALDDETEVPWFRVVNARGAVSARSGKRSVESLQRRLLEAEGVVFGVRGTVDLERFGWK